ncbi:hypothetical protein D3C87_1033640 [compost metagenome]
MLNCCIAASFRKARRRGAHLQTRCGQPHHRRGDFRVLPAVLVDRIEAIGQVPKLQHHQQSAHAHFGHGSFCASAQGVVEAAGGGTVHASHRALAQRLAAARFQAEVLGIVAQPRMQHVRQQPVGGFVDRCGKLVLE